MKLILVLFAIVSIVACNQGNERRRLSRELEKYPTNMSPQMAPAAESVTETKDEEIRASDSEKYIEKRTSPSRKFIRTADLRFKVKEVRNAVDSIEKMAVDAGGFVAQTSLYSQVDRIDNTPVSDDSTLETNYFTVTGDLTLRVPNSKLDEILKSFQSLIVYLDHRTISADDVSLQILENQSTQQYLANSRNRIINHIDEGDDKLRSRVEAERLIMEQKARSNEARMMNMNLMDQVNFSTVRLSIYQRQALKREVVINEKNIDAYKPGFGVRIGDALNTGWLALQNVFIFIAKVWGLILIGLIGFIIYRLSFAKK
jgi:hypothetical protein